MEPITFYAGIMLSRVLAPVVKEGWKKLTNVEAKEEAKRLQRAKEDTATKLMLQRQSHQDRLEEAKNAYENSLNLWKSQKYYERCWPLRNPFEMQICQPISDDKSYFDDNIIVPCRIISSLKDSDHPYARTINGNLSSFIVNYYPTNSIHSVVSEIGAWKEETPSNDASVNYLYAGLKKQPVMVVSPTLINDGKTFIFKVWSWGLGEELNYPAGFEFGRLELTPLYLKIIYKETLKMVQLAKELGQTSKFFSKELQHNISIIKEINDKGLEGEMKSRLLSFMSEAPEINENVKAQMEKIVSGIFCCMAGMYADSYHLLEYKTLPKLPIILDKIPGVEYMIPSLKEYYFALLEKMEEIETDEELLSRLYLEVADAFSKLKFSFANRKNVIEPFITKSLEHFIKNELNDVDEEDLNRLSTIEAIIKIEPGLKNSELVQDVNEVLERSKMKPIC